VEATIRQCLGVGRTTRLREGCRTAVRALVVIMALHKVRFEASGREMQLYLVVLYSQRVKVERVSKG
jgi:hypothetical protein